VKTKVSTYNSIYFTAAFQLAAVLVFVGCKQVEEKTEEEPVFSEIKSNKSGLSFANSIQESDTLNYYNFPYIYMGGGVAIFDADNDGRSDIYVTGNMVENKLYRNTGGMVFEDITKIAGVQGDDRWYTGVAIVDINYDGYLDVYLSVSGRNHDAKNQLFVNNGDLTFEEKAEEYGIADNGKSIQSTFFDYDNDGDLDLFVANYPLVPLSQGNRFYSDLMNRNELEHSGHLYKNQGDRFVDVTAEAGVQNFGLTLGLSSADFNNDGWSDLYLSNDFNVPDYFYLNNGDGTFKEVLQKTFRHTSMFGMGIDAADFNNDGLIDLVQADMTPEDYTRAKVNMASMSTASFWERVNLGFHFQYMQNSLQLNNGMTNGLPQFSEISRFSGIATTDWSWSTLFFDMDNDGFKDLYVTNGMKRDVNDNDLNQRTDATTFKAAFSKKEISEYPSEPLSNYAFRNKGDLTFEKTTDAWGLDYTGFSNGMAYGDLDNDGDLDLLINNLDQELSLFENRSNGHYLRVKLNGTQENPTGIGAKLVLKNTKSGMVQIQELLPVRGFQSAMEQIAHFGLGDSEIQRTLAITWPDGKQEVRSVSKSDTLLTIDYSSAEKKRLPHSIAEDLTSKFIEDSLNLPYRHTEDLYNDYRYEPLLPHKYSTLGPGLTVADVNNDGLDDFFVGNAKGQTGKLFEQTKTGSFSELNGPWQTDTDFEDTGALFFDADADGDQDLYVVSGGYHKNGPDIELQDRLYLNIDGTFKKSNALPFMTSSGKKVASCDFDKDGDQDLFIGGRVVPGKYPTAPKSYILENIGGKDEDLKFKNVTKEISESLSDSGMITDALWADIDGDRWKDLIVLGEWMPVTIFRNNEGQLINETEKWGLAKNTGWWYGLQVFDMENDGDLDLVVGNLGLNYKYKASIDKPFEVFYNDFDENGTEDIVLGVHKEGRLLPLRGRECSSQQIPAIKAKYGTYREFAAADLPEIYGVSMLEKSEHYTATTFAHYWLENTGEGTFKWHKLPNRSQISPMNSILLFDYNQDEYTDLLVSGSLYDSEVETPRADAGVGLILQNDGGKGFIVVEPNKSGLILPGNLQHSAAIGFEKENGFLFSGSNERVKLVRFKKSG